MNNAHAQLGFCTGNSGDPIFTEDFGTGIGNNPLPAGTTTYAYSNGAPNDGFYTVSSNTAYFDWFDTDDVTPGDTNGKMLIVNSDFTAGEFYRTTINGLCENTTYEFSSWVLNLSPLGGFCGNAVIPINVGFEIWDNTNTNLLASGNTGNITSTATPEWNQYALVFQTLPAQGSVILKMINNGVGGCGNDIAIDDIVFKSCGDFITISDSMADTSISICEDITPFSTLLTATPDFSIFSTHAYQWQESSDGTTWTNIAGETNDNYTVPGITNTMFYRVLVAQDPVNLNNPLCNVVSEVFEITVDPLLTPIFNAIGPICNGDTIGNLSTTSTNGVSGTWFPAINNTATTTYTFTPNAAECATTQTLTIVVNPILTPTFNAVAPICEGDILPSFPTASNNGIVGTWSPALDNTTTTTYTFTPNAGECATTETLTIVVNPIITPTFNAVAAICNGDALATLPVTSTNGITGTWLPALDNTVTTTYTFTPDAGQCAVNETLTITVNQPEIPLFDPVDQICIGSTLAPLTTTSNNGITGTWTPALDDTTTTTYTFTPDIDQCALNQTLTIIINQALTPTFDPVGPICNGDALADLPTTSTNGVTGVWAPAMDNTTTTTYTFTPDAGQCPITEDLTVVVNPLPVFSLVDDYILCLNADGIGVIRAPTISTGLSIVDYSFIWTNADGDMIGTDASYIPTIGGNYSVLVTNRMTGCQNDATTLVIESSPPAIEAGVTTDPFSSNHIIEVTVSGLGDYEYNLDGGPWQDSPIFDNVSYGNHMVTARDKNDCGEASLDLCVIGYPKFMTPNGDTVNETWNIYESTCFIEARVYIFDRYGKLLKELTQNSEGWNGTFNGNNVPTDDYWFVIRYMDPSTSTQKEFKGHFSLKR